MFFVLIINLGFWSLNSSSCGPAFEDGMGGKKHQNGKPRVSSKNLVFWDEPYVFVVFGGTRYIYTHAGPRTQDQIHEGLRRSISVGCQKMLDLPHPHDVAPMFYSPDQHDSPVSPFVQVERLFVKMDANRDQRRSLLKRTRSRAETVEASRSVSRAHDLILMASSRVSFRPTSHRCFVQS